MGALTQAWDSRKAIGDGTAGANVILPLHGGRGALVKRAASRRLVTIVSRADAEAVPQGVAGWLEKTQARRSAVLVVPDRPIGVLIALRWGLSPERFRLADDFDAGAPANAVPESSLRRPWHSNR